MGWIGNKQTKLPLCEGPTYHCKTNPDQNTERLLSNAREIQIQVQLRNLGMRGEVTWHLPSGWLLKECRKKEKLTLSAWKVSHVPHLLKSWGKDSLCTFRIWTLFLCPRQERAPYSSNDWDLGKCGIHYEYRRLAILIVLVWRRHKIINILGMSAFIWCKKVSYQIRCTWYLLNFYRWALPTLEYSVSCVALDSECML